MTRPEEALGHANAGTVALADRPALAPTSNEPKARRRVVVTGGAGFVGSSVVEAFVEAGDEVSVIDDLSSGSRAHLAALLASQRITLHVLSVTDTALSDVIAAEHPDVICHLAARASVPESILDPVTDAQVNLCGTIAVLEAARTAKVGRVLYAASGGSLYGERADPADEGAPRRPSSPYGLSKAAALDYLALYRSLHGLPYCALALANVYGPRQAGAGAQGEGAVVATFLGQALAKQPATIDGDGRQTRDFVFVDDVASAFVAAATCGEEGLYNISSGVATTIIELHRLVGSLTGTAIPPRHGPERNGDLRHSRLDPSRAWHDLGWRARTPLDAGLRRMLEAARRAEQRAAEGLGDDPLPPVVRG